MSKILMTEMLAAQRTINENIKSGKTPEDITQEKVKAKTRTKKKTIEPSEKTD